MQASRRSKYRYLRYIPDIVHRKQMHSLTRINLYHLHVMDCVCVDNVHIMLCQYAIIAWRRLAAHARAFCFCLLGYFRQ